ncbi:MAG: hypothetical protein M5U09_16750 [Gammaproteobacteria bacterium]|nr:hypothetical protein [Gammaproteobacteria bacterium]
MLAADDDADAVALQWNVGAEGVAVGSEPESAPSGGDLADAAPPAGEGGSGASRATEDAVGTAAEQAPTDSAEPLPQQPEIIAASTEPRR